MISVIIPTYKEPDALDLCLRSCIEGQNSENEIIVVADGFREINSEVLNKYIGKIEILDIEENVGMIRAMNYGIYNSSEESFLVVNDDNVFPTNWDIVMEQYVQRGRVLTPNQIEPTPSMFRQFVIKDLGRDPKTFDLNTFQAFERITSEKKLEPTGHTPPFAMYKKDYLMVGGWDENYPGPWVVDWDFFLKCELAGFEMMRTYDAHFYHFVSLGTTDTPERIAEKQRIEQECHEYFEYKWGQKARHDPYNNSKMLRF